mmetsp:Transcript_28375/g.74521  ORF Transcript_28375/g.74521 Transcript_28375/m.74521 type:complete len:266 (-) Transcript_28375:900-1697(-)
MPRARGEQAEPLLHEYNQEQSNAVWSNPRTFEDEAVRVLELDDDTVESQPIAAGDGGDESEDDPFRDLPEGPRTIHIIRASDGFGFTVAGSQPVRVKEVTSGSLASAKGLKPGDQIMEINGHEMIEATLEEVLSRIQRCSNRLSMVVIPGPTNPTIDPHSWQAALMALEGDHGRMDIAINPTQMPPSNLGPAVCSVLCCPLVGAAAVWHSRMVRPAWHEGGFNRARAHALMSRKLSTSAVLYGVLILFFIIFVNLSAPSGDKPKS